MSGGSCNHQQLTLINAMNIMKKEMILSILFCLTLGHTFAQDPHSAKISDLNFLVGNWSVEVESRLSMQGPWEQSKAYSVIQPVLKSTLLEEEFTGSRQDRPFLIKTLFGINNINNKYQRMFSDSEHGVLVVFEGAHEKETVDFYKDLQFTDGTIVKLRVVYTIISGDEFTIESMRMAQGMTAWDTTGRMRYLRVK